MLRVTLLALAALLAAPAAAEVVTGVARVADGDTLEIDGRRIRLFGIDAPELAQRCDLGGEAWACGEDARAQLSELIGTRPVQCIGDEIDEYDRLVAVCSVGSTEINQAMVEYGWATAFRHYSQDYVSFEAWARAERLGLWRSTFQLPEEYRIEEAERLTPPVPRDVTRRAAAPRARPSGECLIKGNRNSRGEWIYHLPGRPYYAETRAEEIFCTEEEAMAAGYRRSKA